MIYLTFAWFCRITQLTHHIECTCTSGDMLGDKKGIAIIEWYAGNNKYVDNDDDTDYEDIIGAKKSSGKK